MTKDDSPLRQYVVRKKQYDAVNTAEMKTQFDKLDQAVNANIIADQTKQSWGKYQFETVVGELATNSSAFFHEIDKKTNDEKGSIIPKTEELRGALFGKKDQKDSLREEFIEKVDSLTGCITRTASAINSAHDSISERAKTERDGLEKAGMPTGAKQREAKKSLFAEAELALQSYKEQIQKFCDLYRMRKDLFIQLEEMAKRRTELRVDTAREITEKLRMNLDPSVLVVEADARAVSDKKDFESWLDKNLFPPNSKSKNKKIEALLEKNIQPKQIRHLLFDIGTPDILVVNPQLKVSEGKIDADTAKQMVEYAQICYKFSFENDIIEQEVKKEDLPEKIQKGIMIFTEDESKIEAFLQLDEIVFDDIPEIRLKDRPKEMEIARPITELSAGQRCSAILPIILLNGDCPLIIDQPEDNLDNRLVREVVVNILAAMKLKRQIIMATHNPNLPVLGDVEQAIILKAIEQNRCGLQAIGDIERTEVVKSITEIMEGGREAFQYRQSIYQTHWNSPVEEPTGDFYNSVNAD